MYTANIEIFIVDDSATVRKVLRDVLSIDPSITVIGAAHNPVIALKQMAAHWPDVIITDINMPEMDGLTFIKEVMSTHPTPMVVCSAFTPQGSDTAMKALAYGAIDVIAKPDVGTSEAFEISAKKLIPIIKNAATTSVRRRRGAGVPLPPPAQRFSIDDILPPSKLPPKAHTPVIAIGSSTGGTTVIETILQNLPLSTPPIVIVQHMPAAFTSAFAQRLDAICQISVHEVHGDMLLKPGNAYLAPGGAHLVIERTNMGVCVQLKHAEPVNRFKPSADVLFRSVAQCVGAAGVGIILTGLGDDGAQGMLDLHKVKAHTFAQDQASCSVYGMPKAAFELGAIEKQLSPEKISLAIKALFKPQRDSLS